MDINPYIKGLDPTLDSWRPLRYNEGLIMREEKLKISKLDRKWKRVE